MLDYLQVGYIHQVPFTRSVIYRHFSTLTSKMCNTDAKQLGYLPSAFYWFGQPPPP